MALIVTNLGTPTCKVGREVAGLGHFTTPFPGYIYEYIYIYTHIYEHTAQMKLTHALISCRMVVTVKKAKAITKGDLHLATTRLKLKGGPPWNTFRSKEKHSPILQSVSTNSHFSVEPRQPCIFSDGTEVHLECPKCLFIKPCTRHPLFGKNGFCTIFCLP